MCKKIFAIILAICLLVIPITLFSGCGITEVPNTHINYILVNEGGSSWVRYYNVKGYKIKSTGAVVIELTTGEQVITDIKNIVIKIKGE